MTPREILEACEHGEDGHSFAGAVVSACFPCAEAAIAAAVPEEREACAEVAEDVGCANGSRPYHDGGCCESHRAAADAIRARGGK